MNGDLRVSFKPVPATNYVRMTVSVNGTRFRMTLKHIIPSDFQEELISLSSTLFRIYKESLLQHKPITAKELKKQLTASTPSLLYKTIYRSCTSHFLSIGKTISLEQYQFQLKTIKSIPIFCQLTYGIPEISILALPDTFLDQLEAFFANHSTEKHRSREQVQLIRTILLKEYRKGNIKLSDPLNQQLTLHNILEELTPEDVFYLQEVHLPCHYAAIRDIFIFSCFTGLNYASIKQLTCRQLRTMSDGSLWLFLKEEQIPIPDLSKQISNKISKISNDQLLFNKIPTIQLINRVLHIIALKSNIYKTITFKSAGKYYLSQQSVTKTKR